MAIGQGKKVEVTDLVRDSFAHSLIWSHAMASSLNVRLDDDVKNAIARYAEATGKSQSVIAAEAIQSYIRHHEWLEAKVAAARTSPTVSEDKANRQLDELEGSLAD